MMHLLHSVRPDKQYLWVQENLQPLYHDWLSSSFLYAANAFGIGYFSFNSPLSANSIPGISSPALTRYPLICHSTWLKMCFASGSFSSTDAPPPRRSSTSFSESFPSRFGNSYRDASSPVSSRFLMAILSPYFTNNTVFSSIFLFFFGAFTGIAEIRFLFLASHTV